MSAFESLVRDVRYALRALRGRPALVITACITLALSIGVSSSLFGIIDTLFFRVPAHVREPARIVRVYMAQDPNGWGPSTSAIGDFRQYSALGEYARGFSALAAFVSRPVIVGEGANARQVTASIVTASFFPLLGVRPVVGHFFTEEDDRAGLRPAVLSEEMWRSDFGADPAILGREIMVGKRPYSIIGVAPAGFTGISFEPVGVWLPMRTAASENGYSLNCGGCYWLSIAGRLREGAVPSVVSSEATAVLRQASAEQGTDAAITVMLGPIQAARGPDAPAQARLSLWIGAMSFLVLLIACANITTLLLARAMERQRELAIRLALGASRMRLLLQLTSEGAVLAIAGGIAALLVALLAHRLLAPYLLPEGARGAVFGGRVLMFTAAITLTTVVLVNLLPASRALLAQIGPAMAAGSHGQGRGQATARRAMLVGQMALALVLIVGAALVVRSFRNVAGQPLGFDPDHLIVVSADLRALGYANADINTLYERLAERAARLPGVADASLAIGSPFALSMAIPLRIPGVADSLFRGRMGAAYFQAVSPTYFSALGAGVVRGRGFQAGDVRGAPKVAVVNATMARWVWRGQDPIGQCIHLADGECRTIVGIMPDVRRNSLIESPTLQYYVPLAQVDVNFHTPVTALLMRTAKSSQAMVTTIARETRAVSTEHFDVLPAADLYEWQLRPRRLGSLAFSLLGALALVMAAVGLYGTLDYTVTRQTRDLGIRAALGATRGALVSLVMREGLGIAAVGSVIGIAVAVMGSRAIASLLYGISPSDPVVLLGAVGLLLLIGAAAGVVPAWRAARVDPLVALRHD